MSLTCVSVVIAVQGGVVAVVGATVLAGENSAFKYRESGSVEQAIVAGTGSLLQVGWGLVGGALDKGYKMGKGAIIGLSLITDTGFEVAGKSMEGKKGSELVKAATIKSLAGALGNALPAAIEKKFGEAVEEITARTDLDRMIAEVGAGAGLKSLEIRMGADDAPLPAGVERRTALPGSTASAATAFVNRRAFKRHPVHKH